MIVRRALQYFCVVVAVSRETTVQTSVGLPQRAHRAILIGLVELYYLPPLHHNSHLPTHQPVQQSHMHYDLFYIINYYIPIYCFNKNNFGFSLVCCLNFLFYCFTFYEFFLRRLFL